ncbi:MAG: NAD(P)-binding protein [Gammaproteobacteria bacterium]|nr:NAD(P)-binding protein [Gammaproteobacteria bacterium]
MSGRPEEMNAITISGAGPAGLAAAITIARHGRRAVVHEQRAEVGGRFHGDFQGLENWTTQGDVLEQFAGIGIAPTFDCMPVREMVFYDPKAREYVFRSSHPALYLVRRGTDQGTLDHNLKQQALAAGVEIRLASRLETLPQQGIVAHGPRSGNVIAVGYLFETDAPDGIFACASDRLAPKGYAYMLIHGGRGTLATCMFADFVNQKMYLERTAEFFQNRTGVEMKNPRRFGGAGGIFWPRSASRDGRLYAGEAAGFQDAMFGFGIRYAVLSGHLAGLALTHDAMRDYERLWRRELGPMMKTSLVNRYFYARLGERGYVGLLRNISRAGDVRDWLRNYYAPSWLKTLWFQIAKSFLSPYPCMFNSPLGFKHRCPPACGRGSKRQAQKNG